MGWRDEQRALHEAQLRTLTEIEARIAELKPPVVREERPGHVAHPGRFLALRIALRLCRDVSAGEGLVQRFVKVPESHMRPVSRELVCVCGSVVPWGDLRACPGSCGRWFAADESGAWAARFPIESEAA